MDKLRIQMAKMFSVRVTVLLLLLPWWPQLTPVSAGAGSTRAHGRHHIPAVNPDKGPLRKDY